MSIELQRTMFRGFEAALEYIFCSTSPKDNPSPKYISPTG